MDVRSFSMRCHGFPECIAIVSCVSRRTFTSRADALTFSPASIRRTISRLNARLTTRIARLLVDPPERTCPHFSCLTFGVHFTTLTPFRCRSFSVIAAWLEPERRVIAKAKFTGGEANPRFVVTSLKRAACKPKYLYEKVYCAHGAMENRIKECQLDLHADRTSTATMRASQLRLWFVSMAYVLICALRRIALHHTPSADATCGTVRLKLLKIGAIVRISVRRIKDRDGDDLPVSQDWRRAAKKAVCPIARSGKDSLRYPG
jgi:hypothetical protein